MSGENNTKTLPAVAVAFASLVYVCTYQVACFLQPTSIFHFTCLPCSRLCHCLSLIPTSGLRFLPLSFLFLILSHLIMDEAKSPLLHLSFAQGILLVGIAVVSILFWWKPRREKSKSDAPRVYGLQQVYSSPDNENDETKILTEWVLVP